jgi:adenylosuccinate lyase
VERVIAPDSTILMDYMLHRLTGIVANLVVHTDRMQANLDRLQGLIFSQQVLMKLASKGLTRQEAYDLVQRNALKVWETGSPFKQRLLEDPDVRSHLSAEEIEGIFRLDYHLAHVDEIFDRVFGRETAPGGEAPKAQGKNQGHDNTSLDTR